MIKISERIKFNIIKSSVLIILPIMIQILVYLLFPNLILCNQFGSVWEQILPDIYLFSIVIIFCYSVITITKKYKFLIFLPFILLLLSLLFFLISYGNTNWINNGLGFASIIFDSWYIIFLYIGISLIPSSIILYYTGLVKFKLFK